MQNCRYCCTNDAIMMFFETKNLLNLCKKNYFIIDIAIYNRLGVRLPESLGRQKDDWVTYLILNIGVWRATPGFVRVIGNKPFLMQLNLCAHVCCQVSGVTYRVLCITCLLSLRPTANCVPILVRQEAGILQWRTQFTDIATYRLYCPACALSGNF